MLLTKPIPERQLWFVSLKKENAYPHVPDFYQQRLVEYTVLLHWVRTWQSLLMLSLTSVPMSISLFWASLRDSSSFAKSSKRYFDWYVVWDPEVFKHLLSGLIGEGILGINLSIPNSLMCRQMPCKKNTACGSSCGWVSWTHSIFRENVLFSLKVVSSFCFGTSTVM